MSAENARTTFFLARHGQTVWHAENRYAGVSDIDLTAAGHEQAARLARWTAGRRPDAVVCSPVRRAMETALPSATELGVPLVVVEALREVSFGVAEGHTLAELQRADAGMVARFLSDPVAHPFTDGEPPEDAAVRGADALRELADTYAGQCVLVVAHNTLLRLTLCALLGIEVSLYRQVFPRLDNAGLTEIRLAAPDTTASLLSFNVPVTAPNPSVPRRTVGDQSGRSR